MSKEGMRYMNYLKGKAGERRGGLSEGNVEVALRARHDVIAVEKAPKWSPRDMAGIDFVAHFAQRDKNSGKVTIQKVPVQSKSNERAIEKFDKTHDPEAFIRVNGQASWSGISNAIDRQAENMGIVEVKPQSIRPEPGKEYQVFPAPQELPKAA